MRPNDHHRGDVVSETESPIPPDATGLSSRGVDRQSVCEYNLRMTIEFVKMADQKARFLMRTALALFGAGFVGLPPAIAVLSDAIQNNAGPSSFIAFVVVMALYLVYSLCLLVAIMKMIDVVRPRIIDGANDDKPSPFFFQSIANMPIEDFKRQIKRLEPEQAIDELATQTYHNARVAVQKFRKLNEAINWMLGGGLFGVAFALLVIISFQLLL
ncbi:MAG: Pycsar system effector family protein [Planctomycetota bacterium]|jgi:hypothetical protein